MTKDFILDLVINYAGEEVARELKGKVLELADKMDDKKVYVVKRLGKKGVCIMVTDSDKCEMDFSEKPTILELEKEIKTAEI